MIKPEKHPRLVVLQTLVDVFSNAFKLFLGGFLDALTDALKFRLCLLNLSISGFGNSSQYLDR